MLLHAFKTQETDNPHQIFELALKNHPDQIYSKKAIDVNHAIQTHPLLKDVKDKHLSVAQLWEGEKNKGKRPQDYTDVIVAAAIVPGSYQKTPYGERYDRVSIQPSWLTKKLVIVKEETHADELQKKMIFLGKEVDIKQYKDFLIFDLLEEHFTHHSPKTKDILGSMNKEEASRYLQEQFENLFATEKPPLFHVIHGVKGEEDVPYETWDLVRLAPMPQTSEELNEVNILKEKISNSVSTRLYIQTLFSLEKKAHKPN
jgi:hypothetical protein